MFITQLESLKLYPARYGEYKVMLKKLEDLEDLLVVKDSVSPGIGLFHIRGL